MIAGPLDPATVEAFVQRTLDEAEAEGLPRHVTDPDVLDRIARIVAPREEARPDERASPPSPTRPTGRHDRRSVLP